MSKTTKKNAVKIARYTDEQKKEILDFVQSYNEKNVRGGQAQAVSKFSVSPITVASWLKAATPSKAVSPLKVATAPKKGPAPKAVAAPKAVTAPKAAASTSEEKNSLRYTSEQKAEILAFVASHNAENGRGGQSTAAAKFNVSPLTVMAWLKATGAPKFGNKSTKVVGSNVVISSDVDAKLSSLLALSSEISNAEGELNKLKAKFVALKSTI